MLGVWRYNKVMSDCVNHKLKTKILLYLVAVVAVILSFPVFSKSTVSTKIYYEEYSAYNQSFSVYSERGDIEDTKLYVLRKGIEKQLIKQNLKVVESKSQSEADFHVVFIDVDTLINDEEYKKYNIDPVIKSNKYSGMKDVVPVHFTSPWMKGTLFKNKNKVIGATIKIVISPFQQVKSFYHGYKDEWGLLPSFSENQMKEYVPTWNTFYKLIDIYDQEFNSKKQPTFEEVELFFSPYGEVMTIFGQIARFEGTRMVGSAADCKICRNYSACQNLARIYHDKLYIYFLSSLLAQTFLTQKTKSQIVDITPTFIEHKRLYEIFNGRDKNCFFINKGR